MHKRVPRIEKWNQRNKYVISCKGEAYKVCMVTGRLDGILPPIWLLLRSLEINKRKETQRLMSVLKAPINVKQSHAISSMPLVVNNSPKAHVECPFCSSHLK